MLITFPAMHVAPFQVMQLYIINLLGFLRVYSRTAFTHGSRVSVSAPDCCLQVAVSRNGYQRSQQHNLSPPPLVLCDWVDVRDLTHCPQSPVSRAETADSPQQLWVDFCRVREAFKEVCRTENNVLLCIKCPVVSTLVPIPEIETDSALCIHRYIEQRRWVRGQVHYNYHSVNK